MIIGGSPVDVSLAAARPQCRRSCLWAERVGWAPATAIFDPLRVQMDSNIEQVTTVVGVFGAARLRSLPRSAQQGSEPSLFASLVGLRGYKLNPAIKRYLAAGLAVHEACREPPHRQHRIAKRLPAGTLQKLVAEYGAGTPAAELCRRYGLAKSTVLNVLRVAGVSVRYPRLSAADGARVVELYGQGLPQTEIAAQVGRSPGAIWHILQRAGLVGRRLSL
jgi:hypothetical protein